MRQATGFITDDGTFFFTEEEARQHETESYLRGQMTLHFPQIDVEGVLNIVDVLRTELLEYINASNKARADRAEEQNRAETSDRGKAEVPGHRGHVSSAEEDLASLLQFPPRGPSNVSNVGSGPRTEKVQERREEHGTGVRGADAPSVRSGKDMATKQGAEPGPSRPGRRTKNIQVGPLEPDME